MVDAQRDRDGRRLSRRGFIAAAGVGAAGAAGLGLATCRESSPSLPPTAFPATAVARLGDLRVGTAAHATSPDEQSPIVLLKLGRRVPDGVGPDGDIVAYSRICTHMGCSVEVRAAESVPSARFRFHPPVRSACAPSVTTASWAVATTSTSGLPTGWTADPGPPTTRSGSTSRGVSPL
jgi:hypothetical protein